MEGISDLLLHPPLEHERVEEEEEEEEYFETLDSIHSCFLQYLDRPIRTFSRRSPESPPSDSSFHDPILLDDSEEEAIEPDVEIHELEDSNSELYSGSDSRSDLFEGVALNLFDRSHSQQTHVRDVHASNSFVNSVADSDFTVFEENVDMGQNVLELGLGFSVDPGHSDSDKGDICDMVTGDGSGDEFYIENSGSGSVSCLSSEICEFDRDGLQISAGFGSDSDSDDGRVVPVDLNSDDGGEAPDRSGEDLGLLPLCCWDCLRLGDGREPVEDFEWEEVDRGTVAEVNEAMNMEIEEAINMEFDASIDEEQSVQETDNAAIAEGVIRSLDWEVLLAVNNLEHLEQNPVLEQETESYVVDHEDYIHTTEYEVLFGQFTEVENSLRGSPPAAKYIVENLPSVSLTKEDIENNNALCAVCKDEISLEEHAKRLPCAHHYHADCILPWLGIRNTCPVCRFELPTDDPDYEHWRRQRAARGVPTEASRIRYDLEVIPQAQ